MSEKQRTLTHLQPGSVWAVYQYLLDESEEGSVTRPVAEIAEDLDMSTASVYRALNRLNDLLLVVIHPSGTFPPGPSTYRVQG